MSRDLLLLGASVRSAAYSAQRAGIEPIAGDLFADADLRALCQTTKVDHYPWDLLRVANDAKQNGWMYTGGLENYPNLVDAISTSHTLYGNPGGVLRRVRDPVLVFKAFHNAGIQSPAVCSGGNTLREGKWLKKPLRGCGGSGILRVTDSEAGMPGASRRYYYQQWVEGTSCGVLFVGCGGRAVLLGVTEQLVGCDWCGASGFRYVGSIGPLPMDERHLGALQKIGECLADEFDLVGLFGVDAILNDNGVWPVEINPRYTSSVEILERGLASHAIGWHMDACRKAKLPQVLPAIDKSVFHGKAILYARRTFDVTSEYINWVGEKIDRENWPVIADVPIENSTVERGSPVTSVFATGSNRETVVSRLREQAKKVQQILVC